MARHVAWTALASLVLIVLSPADSLGQGLPEGQLTIAFDASIATSFLDPADTAGLGTPFVFLDSSQRRSTVWDPASKSPLSASTGRSTWRRPTRRFA